MKFTALSIIPILALACAVLGCREHDEYIQAVERFEELLLNPARLVEGNASSPYAENVVGRADVTNTFIGGELNVEYYFGLFVEADRQNTTQLIGVPRNITMQALVVDPPLAYASFVIDFLQKSINFTVPLQIDFTFRFDDNLLITSYDSTLRRLAQLLKYVLPMLADQIRLELGTDNPSDAEVVAQRAIIDICNIATEHCVEDLLQYESFDACVDFLSHTPFGDAWEGGQNTTWCRYIHKNLVLLRPEIHCPHVGPTGGGMCIERDYLDVVYNAPYTESLVDFNATC
ncbi:hypothetical protein BDZ89DRAFT_1071557 [Hymenopellis radicata]|nr:hypothetical protein BDZ89DRAFT_1071557 [Hymenopellis radicata]